MTKEQELYSRISATQDVIKVEGGDFNEVLSKLREFTAKRKEEKPESRSMKLFAWDGEKITIDGESSDLTFEQVVEMFSKNGPMTKELHADAWVLAFKGNMSEQAEIIKGWMDSNDAEETIIRRFVICFDEIPESLLEYASLEKAKQSWAEDLGKDFLDDPKFKDHIGKDIQEVMKSEKTVVVWR